MAAIKEAIEQLPPEETILAIWLCERDWKAWDKQKVKLARLKRVLLAELPPEIGCQTDKPVLVNSMPTAQSCSNRRKRT